MDLNRFSALQRRASAQRPRDTQPVTPRIQFDPSIPVARIQQAMATIGCKLVATADGLRVIPRG